MAEEFVTAIRKGDLTSIKTLVMKSGSNVTDKDGFPVLHLAVIHNKEEIVRFFIDHGVNVEGKRPDGSTALMQAAWENKPTLIQILLAAGADINATNDRGSSALSFAAGKGLDSVVQALCFQGAKILKNAAGKSPIQVAEDHAMHSCVAILKEYEKKVAGAAGGGGGDSDALAKEVADLKKQLSAAQAEIAALKAQLASQKASEDEAKKDMQRHIAELTERLAEKK